jgi:biotin-dependent carboxylase-like uncharacterized protein
MSIETLEILQPGLLTTVQDTGRYGHQRYGVPVSGAMDLFSLRAANLLVGNDQSAACLEMTAIGPRARFLTDAIISITGGDLAPLLNDEPLAQWRCVRVARNSVLSFRGPRDGLRSYLAIAGGIDVPKVLGSRSTYLKSAIGGLEGRALVVGDVLSRGESTRAEPEERGLPDTLEPPTYGHHHEVRVVLGPQAEAFTENGIATLLGSEYSVSADSDRMGYRLDGPIVEHLSDADIISDGTPLGAIQVPGDGQPIILLADRGTAGGYAKVATVIGPDVSRLGQAMPGDTLRFKSVTVEEAHSILREQEDILLAIAAESGPASPPGDVTVIVDGEAFRFDAEAGEATPAPDGHGGNLGRTRNVRATVNGEEHEFEVRVGEDGSQRP